ncbi:multidrug resistance efflux transporter family protein [Paenibacillus sp. P96]|uniref:Multidrug resistance efflux transporter family protein n=1 Tax=Paenibacillus zeirhizosphaerae TaxID=2987519 RepID=A0ABT9FVH9_9BACL|nr:multidrug resistance efflux transporter family protein [Paenibacillus sp. P96]MDP4098700.1 multidrug resistance efflux transporter family protein [Paenibacillus sp. P96]
MKPLWIGILSAFFFAFTFILNRIMNLEGGHWAWSASLRYEMMLPLLLLLVALRGGVTPVFREVRSNPGQWMLWSFIGFVLFYAPICFASVYGPGWLVAATWQLTIVIGLLIAPLLEENWKTRGLSASYKSAIPAAALCTSLLILLGVVLVQMGHAASITSRELLLGALPIVVACAAYPAGNRKLMQISGGRLDAPQRVLAMTLCSLPFWLLLSLYAFVTSGPPSGGQLYNSLLVAVFSGVAATVLFFQATQMVRSSPQRLAGVEATQSLEVVFALIAEVIVLSAPLPGMLGWAGLILVVGGMIIHSFALLPKEAEKTRTARTESAGS